MIYPILLFSDLEWKIIYVGSAESEEYDQTLDTVVVGPIIAGRHMFVFEVGLIRPQHRSSRSMESIDSHSSRVGQSSRG